MPKEPTRERVQVGMSAPFSSPEASACWCSRSEGPRSMMPRSLGLWYSRGSATPVNIWRGRLMRGSPPAMLSFHCAHLHGGEMGGEGGGGVRWVLEAMARGDRGEEGRGAMRVAGL